MGRISQNAGSARRSFTVVELLTVIAIVTLLTAIVLSSVQSPRARVRDVGCTSNFRSVGQAIHSFVNTHDDYAAPCVRERDYYWDRGKQIGWDIETGRWTNIPGGPDMIWRCPVGDAPSVTNEGALDSENRGPLADSPGVSAQLLAALMCSGLGGAPAGGDAVGSVRAHLRDRVSGARSNYLSDV